MCTDARRGAKLAIKPDDKVHPQDRPEGSAAPSDVLKVQGQGHEANVTRTNQKLSTRYAEL
jgi:hypothetical protein